MLMKSFDAAAQLDIQFPAADGLMINAKWYPVSDKMPVMLLCHQNRYSSGEYIETAIKLNKFGFNCLALDQRVGGEVNGIQNKTAELAKKKGLSPEFLDAAQDITAAIDYLYNKYHKQIILVGSSYTASLALVLANKNPKVVAVIAFSPGEYFPEKSYVKDHMKGFDKPLLAISSLAESSSVKNLIADASSVIKTQYIPSNAGDHGSKVLWSSYKGNEEYWVVLMNFLDKIRFLD